MIRKGYENEVFSLLNWLIHTITFIMRLAHCIEGIFASKLTVISAVKHEKEKFEITPTMFLITQGLMDFARS